MDDKKNLFSEDDFSPERVERKVPKNVLIEFLTATQDGKNTYEFLIQGDAGSAKAFIHNMRVELSRLRREAIQRGRKPTQFKMVKKEIHCENFVCRVILEKVVEKVLAPDLSGVFDSFCLPED